MSIQNKEFHKILVVTDEKIIQESIKQIFNDKYELILVSDFQALQEILEKDEISLILLDHQLSSLDSLSFALKLFEIFAKKEMDIPILLLIDSLDENIINEAFNIGISDYIRKPINSLELKARVKNILGKYITNNKLHQQSQELHEYKKILNQSDIVSKASLDGTITYANDKFCEISGYSLDELIGKNHNILRHPDTPKTLFKDLWETIKNKKTFNSIIKNRKKNGDSYYVDATISPILDLKGDIVEYVAIRHDVTSMMNPKKHLLDSINNIENPIIVLAQISNYDIIREFYLDSIRTKFEKEFEKTLFKSLPAHTTVKRIYNLGNGLFGFVKKGPQDATNVNLFLEEILKKIKKNGFEFEGNKYEVDVVFSFSSKGKHLFEDALIGIYQGLENKKYIIYAEEFYINKQKDAKNKLDTLVSIKNALKQPDKVVSYYQPIVENKTKKVVKYESLIRMINQKDEVLSPYFFLDLAKKTGYYHDITLRVIENANKILEVSDIYININLSLSDLKDIQIRTELLNLITKDKNQGRITFELLEDENIKDFSLVKDFIGLSKILGGVTIAIDDFGSGYSNYERLLDFQPDYIKIDGSLIRNIQDSYSRSVIKSIVLFAKENNLKTVAEFVGDEEIYNAVNELDIDFSQGFYFGKPEPYNV